MSYSGKHHWDTVLVGSIYTVLIFYTSTRLDDGFDPFFGAEIYYVTEREKCIGSQNKIS
ncbi:hypothetical protein BN1195_02313 [Chryseobacterium oranimense G311]|nr:hypothetical protein BN1195_02313 [Chryseobacterium oranimense G311]